MESTLGGLRNVALAVLVMFLANPEPTAAVAQNDEWKCVPVLKPERGFCGPVGGTPSLVFCDDGQQFRYCDACTDAQNPSGNA